MPSPNFLDLRLRKAATRGTLRELPGERSGVDFWSNDYLGFARIARPAPSATPFSSGSRLISGDHAAIHRLERRIAVFHGYPAALLFGSGYLANLGLLSCIAGRTDTIIYDELIHASLRDGIRLSGAAARRCKHNSVADAERLLRNARSDGQRVVVTEGRFSMDGDIAPLRELADLCQRLGAWLIVDEAHSVGLAGPKGAGLVAELGLQGHTLATVVTYGKAPGYQGAAVLGSESLREYLINFCRPFIYTTGPHAEQVSGLQATYDLLQERQTDAVGNLKRIITYYHNTITRSGLSAQVQVADGPIQIIPLAGNDEVMRVESLLMEAGYLVKGIRSPTVAAGSERLRICLHAFNTRKEVDGLIGLLTQQLAS